MATVLSGCDGMDDLSDFEAVTIARNGSLDLDLTPDAALPLFTAPGEKLWVPHWDPLILHGDGTEQGTAFVTSNHGATTYWLVTAYDAEANEAQYVRVTPGANTGTVDVAIVPSGSGGSTVHVSYQLTGLSVAGNDELARSFSEQNYSAMMQEWKSLIEANRSAIDDHLGR